MHKSAFNVGGLFFDVYCSDGQLSVADIGSQNVNGTLRSHINENIKQYVGIDFAEGRGVDIVLTDPYKFPFDDNRFDRVVSTSCFEHSELFWLTFLEGMRIIKPDGVMYVNAPTLWDYHAYPVDCWRFYPDAGKALETWCKYNGMNSVLLESFILDSDGSAREWIGIYLKDSNYKHKYKNTVYDVLYTKNLRIVDWKN